MEIERAIQIYAVINLAIIGISHITAPKAWVDFFIRLRDRGEAGVIVVAFMSLGFGSIIVAFHSVWSGLPLVVTLLGWAQILKATIYLVFPAFGLKKLQRVSMERSHEFIYAGIMLLVLAGVIGYHLIQVRT
ncbi:MAG: hypothetical protein GY940_12000 [bacterium]|nr:hypothetical protein [bacterium]